MLPVKKFALLTGLSLALTTGAPLLAPTVIMPAAYADQTETIGITPTDGAKQEYDADHLALEWGIRSSFNNYVGGSTHIFDGAKTSGKSYLWPYLGTDKNEDGSVSINYGGTVNFMKYCTDPEDPQRGACQLDLTLSNPTIKTVPGTGKGMLSVVVHTIDYATKQWSGPERIDFAVVDFDAGRFNQGKTADAELGEVTSWRGVAGALTAAGNQAFSNFYAEHGFVNSLSFSYPGKDALEGTPDGYTVSTVADTTIDFSGAKKILQLKDGNIFVVTSDWGTTKGVVASPDLRTISEGFDVPFDSSNNVVVDNSSGDLIWIKDGTVYAAPVSSTGVGAARELASYPGTATAFASTPAGTYGILSLDGDDAKFTTVTSSGEATTVDLPKSTDVYAKYKLNGNYWDQVYGTTFRSSNIGMQGLNDGTFIFVYDHNLTYGDGDAKRGATPLHISPAKESVAERVSPIEAFEPAFENNNSIRSVVVDDNRIVMYNQYGTAYEKNNSRIVFGHYADGKFTLDAGPGPFGDIAQVAGVGFLEDGNAVIAAQENSTLYTVDPSTGTVVAKAALGDRMKDTAKDDSNTVLVGHDASVYVLDTFVPPNSYDDLTGIKRLVVTKPGEQKDASVPVVTMGDTVEWDNPPADPPAAPKPPADPKPPVDKEPPTGGSSSATPGSIWEKLLGVVAIAGGLATIFGLISTVLKTFAPDLHTKVAAMIAAATKR